MIWAASVAVGSNEMSKLQKQRRILYLHTVALNKPGRFGFVDMGMHLFVFEYEWGEELTT